MFVKKAGVYELTRSRESARRGMEEMWERKWKLGASGLWVVGEGGGEGSACGVIFSVWVYGRRGMGWDGDDIPSGDVIDGWAGM